MDYPCRRGIVEGMGRGWWGVVLVGTLAGCGGAVAGGDGSSSGDPPREVCADAVPAGTDHAPGSAETLVAASSLTALAIDDEEVFFASADGATPLSAARKSGHGNRVVARIGAYRIVVHGDELWVGGGGRDLLRVDKRTGESKPFAGDGVFDFAVDDSAVYVANLALGIERIDRASKDRTLLATGAGAQGLSLRDGWVYWADYGADRIMRVRTTGGPAETLATGEHFPRSVVADCHDVYFSIGNYGETLRRMPLDRSTRPSTVARVGGSFVLDQRSAWIQNAEHTARVSLASGAVDELPGGGGYPGGVPAPIAVDASAVYWITAKGVERAPK